MAAYVVLPIRLGKKTAERVSERFRNLYRLVADAFLEGQAGAPLATLTTIPLFVEGDMAAAVPAVRQLVAAARPALVIVDLANSARTLLPPYSVVSGITQVCQEVAAGNPAPLMVYLVASMLWERDPPYEVVKPMIDAERAAFVADNGEVRGSRPAGFDAAKYVRALQDARRSPSWLLSRKLVRRFGHFKRNVAGAHDHCVPFFFDGIKCRKELSELIVKALGPEHRNEKIFVHDPDSPWLHEAARITALKLRSELCVIDLSREESPFEGPVPDVPSLIVAMCDTGETLRSVIRALRRANSGCRPKIVSVLSTEGTGRESSSRVLEVDGDQHVVHYLLKVSRPRMTPGSCRLCGLGVPGLSATDPDNSSGLSTHAMWSMIFEAGLKAEADVPRNRPSLGLVPDFTEVIHRNGPYLARKMDQLLTREIRKPGDRIIVCPDERGATELADALTSLFKYDVIRVPRTVIDGPQAAAAPVDRLDEWYIQLDSLRRRSDVAGVIVFDEFNASGATRLGLKRVIDGFGLRVQCYFSLFDFNPTLRNLEAPAHTLYSIDALHGSGAWLEPAQAAIDG